MDEETSRKIKEHLLKQLINFPEEKRDFIKKQILAMTNEQLEEFVKQNELVHLKPNYPEHPNPQCIFCSIMKGEIPSYKIDENKDNIAVLEISPLSKGHSLIIPKDHLETTKIPSNSFTLAKKIAKRIKSKFHPKEMKISSINLFGHSMVEVLPLYGDEDQKQRKKASESELKSLQEQLKSEPKQKREKSIKKPKTQDNKQQNPSTAKKESNIPVLKPRMP